MKTFVKIGFAQISLAAPKILVAQNSGEGGGQGEGGVAAPQPQRYVRLWVLSPVFQLNNGVIIMEWIQ